MGLREDGRMERPILFSGPLVRAIREGRKTETRRPVRLPPGYEHGEVYAYGGRCGDRFVLECDPGPGRAVRCPYGLPGELLWVRETWRPWGWDDDSPTTCALEYRADCGEGLVTMPAATLSKWVAEHDAIDGGAAQAAWWDRWRPSIHMPRWASRILLCVQSVRIEQVQDITDAGAVAEGFAGRAAFEAAWRTMYPRGEKAWDANPWVWVVAFGREGE